MVYDVSVSECLKCNVKKACVDLQENQILYNCKHPQSDQNQPRHLPPHSQAMEASTPQGPNTMTQLTVPPKTNNTAHSTTAPPTTNTAAEVPSADAP